MSKSVKRLFGQFVPENYQLEITIDSEKMIFYGKVTIKGKKTGRPSQRLTFHQKGLKISQSKITKTDKSGTSEMSVVRINNQDSLHEVRLHTEENLFPGFYEVELEFSGKITDSMHGLYPCYFSHKGKDKKLFATQFESHHAREVFPCIDEPEAKATFDLTLHTPTGEAVISNTPILSQSTAKKSLGTVFEQTPIMSTYLLAFVCGEMQFLEAKTKSGITVRNWATVAQPKQNLEYSTAEAVKILEYYEDYFGVPFPLKKCDQVALPDFESGAMENWGLITYREVALLADPQNRSVSGEQHVSLVIAHELSHQWFGNLVTMKWWDDLWLNESFAALMEHQALDALHPDWEQWEDYASQDIIVCSNRDIYKDVQAVGVDVKHPDEISTLFDPAIVYAKGGRLLKMMKEYIGDEAFRKALNKYFKQHAYKNTTRDDLWVAMSEASGKDIEKLMTPWLVQSGMPVVKVSGPDKQGTRTLSQSRFVLDKKNDTQIWPIPLLASSKIQPEILTEVSQIVKSDKNKFPILNQNGSGHFVTHYSEESDLKNLKESLSNNNLNPAGKINTLNDMLLLARRGDISIVEVLKLVENMSSEKRDAVWSVMLRGMGLATNLGENNKLVEDGAKIFRYNLAHKNYSSLGWDDKPGEDPSTVHLRATMISLMLGSENSEIINNVLSMYDKDKLEEIPADRRSFIMGTAVKHGDNPEVVDQLINLYKSTHDSDLQISITLALCSSRSEEVTKKIVDDALGENGFVRTQDIFRWYAYLMRSKYTRETAWNWLTSSWDMIQKKLDGAKSNDYFVIYSSSPIQTKEWQQKFIDFFGSKRGDIELGRSIEIALSEIEARVAWRDRELNNIEKYFKSLQ